jgi:hypothetical protein
MSFLRFADMQRFEREIATLVQSYTDHRISQAKVF